MLVWKQKRSEKKRERTKVRPLRPFSSGSTAHTAFPTLQPHSVGLEGWSALCSICGRVYKGFSLKQGLYDALSPQCWMFRVLMSV